MRETPTADLIWSLSRQDVWTAVAGTGAWLQSKSSTGRSRNNTSLTWLSACARKMELTTSASVLKVFYTPRVPKHLQVGVEERRTFHLATCLLAVAGKVKTAGAV